MITLTTQHNRGIDLGRARGAGDVCVAAISRNRGRNCVRSNWYTINWYTATDVFTAHLGNGTTAPAGATGYMSIKPTARHLGPKTT
jgi:hypothetical protein